ncbi:trehalose-phosphatase [Puccinia striiformis f. sp. tritici PST-78]|uniref:Trehalose-phosphatase n=1 Tax=Puccinia striiformis f. sp. tritici PST-78 TaxID=1165861 RepID=A0A0L0VA79_9BASI|nr:trehalose-phosphatase [Puccinia striiformis f. sp. tritici PST-78]
MMLCPNPIILVGLIGFNLLQSISAKLTASWSPASGFAVLERPSQVRSLTSVDVAEYQRSFEESNYRVILLDHDGVMKPVEGFPTEDHENSCEVLEKLASNPKNEVWIISGKKLSNLQEKYGHIPNLNLAGELGTDILAAKGKLAPILPEIYSNTETLLQEVLKLAENISISKTCFIPFKHYIVFRYPQDDPNDPTQVERTLNGMKSLIKQKAFNDFELVTYPGSVFSALIHRGCHKGLLAEKLIERQTHLDTIGLSIGDQYVDEPMHILMRSRGFLSVIVTKHEEQETYARNKLSDHREVYNLLKALSNY